MSEPIIRFELAVLSRADAKVHAASSVTAWPALEDAEAEYKAAKAHLDRVIAWGMSAQAGKYPKWPPIDPSQG